MICEMSLNLNSYEYMHILKPDLATNDVALARGRRGLVVDGAGRLSGISLCPGSNFERILLDLRIDI